MITDTVEDILKKFKNTYVFLEWEKKRILTSFEKQTNDGDFVFYSPQYGDILLGEDEMRTRLSFKFPETGLYNLNGGAVLFSRTPERQWKRAPSEDNCKTTSIIKNTFHFKDIETSIGIHQIEEIYKENYPTSLDTAILELKLTKAVNKSFAISQPTNKKIGPLLLWYKTAPIGTLDPKTKEVTVYYKPLFQETADFLRKKEPTWLLKQSHL